MKKLLLFVLFLVLVAACRQQASNPETQTRIEWDSWGVPHISASSDTEFFFADGWAQMHAHANTLLRLYGVSRGHAAEYWGADFLAGDKMVYTMGHPAHALVMWDRQDPELKQFISAFVAGINAYAEAHPESIEQQNRAVLPVTELDINLHSQFVVNTRFLAGRELGQSRRWSENGSNAIAIGPSRSASGNAMLLQNPHLPWSGEFLWFEKHAFTPRQNIYGAHLVGMPGFSIAFNDHLGWTHTNNTIDNADLYELALSGEGYLFDGQEQAFEKRTHSLALRHEDGSISQQDLTVLSSVHGPVIRMGEHQALALRFAGQGSQDSFLQWWRMANANSFSEFETALKMEQIPFWNVMYADAEGNIFYLFNGQVPRRDIGDWAYWQAPVDGNDPANLWTAFHPYSELPKLLNPGTGWLQNANDPPWTSTLPAQLDADDFPPYMSPRQMGFRPQRAARMMLDDESVSFDELLEIKHDTRMALAERILDDLFAAVEAHGGESAREAAEVLQDWDRNADIDSRGAVLFQNWAMKMNPFDSGVYRQPWDENDPANTPDGLSDPAAMSDLLGTVAAEMKTNYGSLDISWGEVNRIEYNGISLPANGAAGALGVFRVAAARPTDQATQVVRHGDSWVAVIEFAGTPRAKVLLSYGNSTQQDSPHFGDQLKLFSEKKLREAWRTRQQLEGNINRTEYLHNGRFVESTE